MSLHGVRRELVEEQASALGPTLFSAPNPFSLSELFPQLQTPSPSPHRSLNSFFSVSKPKIFTL
jgi:hypothetical protein